MSEARAAFNFNRDFSKSNHGNAFVDRAGHVPIAYSQHLEALEAARHEAHQQGINEGRALQQDEEARQLAASLERVVACMEVVTRDFSTIEATSRREALDFALIFARKLTGRLIDNAPTQTIEATARAIFNDLRGSPHVAVRVAPSLVDVCKVRLSLLMRENGLEPKLFVFPDPDVGLGDCRIEWADGGIVRDRGKLDALIEHSLNLLLPKQAS